MLHFTPSKIAFILSVVAMAIFFCLPNVLPASVLANGPSWWRPMQLGLDLRGGSYLLLEVDTSTVFKQQLADLEETVRSALRDGELKYSNLHATDDAVIITIAQPSDLDTVRAAIAKNISGMTIETEGTDRIRITIPEKVKRDRQIAAVTQSLEIVRRRLDEFGTSEPSIQRQGADRIIVELPGVDNPERIKALIGQTAKLDFHLLEPDSGSLDPKDLPPGTVLMPGSKDENQMYVVRRRVEVSGERLIDAQPTFQNGSPIVSFRFDTAGGRRFGALTTDNVGQRLAVVLDGRVITAPVIKSPIVGGSGIIEGGFSVEGAKDLALLLRAGALPAPLLVIEERVVGPGLGADSIHAGASAAILGGALVVVFMVLAYHSFGVFAVAGQALHMLSLFAVLSILGGTLTLPGIAGVVLSLGMAVDANVLIYERMREESHAGRTLLSAISAGFSNAYATIVDSNLTNFIAAVLLFFLGAGPVRGFAVTLSIGILTSIFSAVMITRLQVWVWYRSGKRRELPI
ncbi:MAG: protein translocase subunit SecD [Rhodospirillaceae bacterium]|nr:MAG: protein translocase subunit SecD [Rhodospirillaceae bacterium]